MPIDSNPIFFLSTKNTLHMGEGSNEVGAFRHHLMHIDPTIF
jgi:hypothetical protein